MLWLVAILAVASSLASNDRQVPAAANTGGSQLALIRLLVADLSWFLLLFRYMEIKLPSSPALQLLSSRCITRSSEDNFPIQLNS